MLACLIFARSVRPVTRLRGIDFLFETGHKQASRGKEVSVSEGDQELRAQMIRYQGGSLEAFQEIYAQVALGVRRYLSHLAGGSEIADDLLQETFLQMHRSRAAYNPTYAVRPWVFGLARNVFLMNRRAARRWAKVHESREDLPEFPVLPEADRLGSQDEIRRCIAHLAPDQAEALCVKGDCLHHLGRNAEAAVSYRRASELEPERVPVWRLLGKVLEQTGDRDGAILALRRARELDPADRFGAAVELMRLGAADVSEMPAAYVRLLFDQYADTFDTALVEKLGYRGPAVLLEAVRSACEAHRIDRKSVV